MKTIKKNRTILIITNIVTIMMITITIIPTGIIITAKYI